jgi:uncharacterized protein
MLKSNSKSYEEIRSYLDTVPVIETHEHYTGIVRPVDDILSFIMENYYYSDFLSSSFGIEKEAALVGVSGKSQKNKKLSFEERFNLFKRIYKKSDKTAYARGLQIGLKRCWGVEKIDDIESIKDLERRFSTRDQSFYERTMKEYGIRAKVVDIFDLKPFVEGEEKDYSKYCRFAFSLPEYHDIHNKADILRLEQYAVRRITCLDDYLESFEAFFKKCIDFGIVCIKDQTAYRRTISYSNPSRGEAEKIFNSIVSRPRDIFGDDEARALDDWLFHYFMRLAAKYELPVQIHTGHMAGIRNSIEKTNAANLTPILELHQDVRFDLFHGNWPYMDEYLFLGKNYPNVWLNLCWVQSIDPVYCIELMKRVIVTVPHTKLLAFGADTGQIEWVVGYLTIARDNVACALSEMVDSGWIDMEEARRIAADWFFNNPNEFYKLGFERFEPS